MNFTREPIIETIITPREGCKLVVRSSKGNGQEDYFVDAVEVVSFGHSFFFRSLERPKSFLVPVSDYEILELKETRMVLKSASVEKSIKIGGGREAPARPAPREPSYSESAAEDLATTSIAPEQRAPEPRPNMDRKRDKRRSRRRGGRDRGPAEPYHQETSEAPALSQEAPGEDARAPMPVESAPMQEQKAPSFISKLFPPPTTLIKESLNRYKQPESTESSSNESISFEEKVSFEETVFEQPPLEDDFEQ